MADPFNINKDNGLGEKDPFDPEIESLFSEPIVTQQPVQEPAQEVPQPELIQTNQEIDTLFSDTTPGVAQAQSLIQLRDDPQALDLFLGTAERIRKGQLPFNKQSWEDAQLNVKKFQDENQPKILEAEQKGNWMEMAKLATLGVGKVLGSYLQAGFGATNEDMEKAQQSLAARNFIGTIKDPNEAAKALELTSLYADELDAGKSITPQDQKPGMAFGTGPLTAKLGMNLAQAEEYLRDLESDRNKKLGTAGLRNFAIQSGDAFLPFVSIGDIVIDDENNPDQVARRAVRAIPIEKMVAPMVVAPPMLELDILSHYEEEVDEDEDDDDEDEAEEEEEAGDEDEDGAEGDDVGFDACGVHELPPSSRYELQSDHEEEEAADEDEEPLMPRTPTVISCSNRRTRGASLRCGGVLGPALCAALALTGCGDDDGAMPPVDAGIDAPAPVDAGPPPDWTLAEPPASDRIS
jgi:hypothetical protein